MSTDDGKLSLETLEKIELDADPKRARILEGAMKVFLAYGFDRTTMDDIARAAEVSRPALYLQFKNKTDIYRAIAQAMLEAAVSHAQTALAGDEPFADRVFSALDGGMLQMMRAVEESPHGAEILDMKNALAEDIIETWRAKMSDSLAGAVQREARRKGSNLKNGFSSAGLADFVLDALEGMKARRTDLARKGEMVKSLIAVVEQAIRP
jgi:AcrR family transcriptional regulator